MDGYFDFQIQNLNYLACFGDRSYSPRTPFEKGCQKCPPCFTCKNHSISLNTGYAFYNETTTIDAPLTRYHAFKCVVRESCPAQIVVNVRENTTLATQPCHPLHTGILCHSCVETAAKMVSTELCTPCASDNSWLLVGYTLLVVAGAIIAYVVLQRYLKRKRSKRDKRTDQAGKLFDFVDLDSSGTVSRLELRTTLAQLGVRLSDAQATEILDSIDVDHSGDIERHEFEAWLRYRKSSSDLIKQVFKIYIGLMQVLKDVPETMQQADEFPNEWKYLQVLAIDIPTLSVQPCVQLGYATHFLINSFIFPGGLLGIVWVTWACSEWKQSNSDTEGQTTKLDGNKLAKRSDL